ncbi:hypothetical protein OE88DRAFT_1649665 [Heliocybe sulcata]|uniref:DUF6533 domain-containing protein n=1 Tax=Heliocybe sulcata TaxID=5364 RepID=A0A5C3NG70_9AGAM|nr:hypothetical protein OE88DRAFT_1649665 [Heliocybe sulcata]
MTDTQIPAADANALYFAVAVLAMTVWEYLIMLDMEIDFFWSGPWTLSRILFFLNRYIPLSVTGLVFHVLCVKTASNSIIISIAVLTGLGLTTTEVMHAVRLWHMFTSSTPIKCVILSISLVYNIVQWALLASYLRSPASALHFYSGKAWIPALLIHFLLFLLTVVRAFVPRRRSADGRWLRNRVLKE